MAKALTVKFTLDRETKNTVRFEEEGDADEQVMGKIYLQKTALAEMDPPNPKTLTVKITGA